MAVDGCKDDVGARLEALESRITELERENARLREERPAPPAVPEIILPDLAQVHRSILRVASGIARIADLVDLAASLSKRERKWMVNLMPIWHWQERGGAPSAEEFWRLAHAVSRDQNQDDWLAPHITLHSRSNDFDGLAEKFVKLLTELPQEVWREFLDTVRDQHGWVFDADQGSKPPSTADHYVLHKAKITPPRSFCDWLEQNQDSNVLPVRKQDRGKPPEDGRYAVTAPFHISLYSFRAARPNAMLLEHTPSFCEHSPRIASHRPPAENDVRRDLASADWMLVLVSPGSAGTPALSPEVYAAVRLSDLAIGSLAV